MAQVQLPVERALGSQASGEAAPSTYTRGGTGACSPRPCWAFAQSTQDGTEVTLKTEVEAGASGYSVTGGGDQGIFVKQVLKDSSAAKIFSLREGATGPSPVPHGPWRGRGTGPSGRRVAPWRPLSCMQAGVTLCAEFSAWK